MSARLPFRIVTCANCDFPLGIKGTQPAVRVNDGAKVSVPDWTGMIQVPARALYKHDPTKGGMGCKEIEEGRAAVQRLVEAARAEQQAKSATTTSESPTPSSAE